jgi:hypothetical protein
MYIVICDEFTYPSAKLNDAYDRSVDRVADP